MALPFEKSLTAEWIPMPNKNDDGAAAAAATAQITPPRSGLVGFAPSLIFGGYIEEGEETLVRSVTNDLWRWDGGRWSNVIKPSNDGGLPGPRLVAAGAVLDNKAYLIGGWNPGAEDGSGGILDDVHVLDLTTHTWSVFPQSFPDGPTSRHVALPINNKNKIWIHNHRCTSHVYLLDPIQQSIVKQPTTGIPPSGRGLHAATTILSSNRILLFGGAAKDGNMSNEVFCLNLETWEWNPVKIIMGPNSSSPTPRASPCMVTLDDHCVLVFGGAERSQEGGLPARGDLWALHLDEDYQSGQWELLCDDDKTAGICFPPPRNGAVLMEQEKSQEQTKEFLLTGGWAPFIQTWSDTFLLRIIRKETQE